MQQVLFRILLDDLWTNELREGVRVLGVGYLLVPWALYGCWGAWRRWRQTGRFGGMSPWGPVAWLGVAVVLLSLPAMLGGRLAANGIPVYGYGFMLFVGFLAAGATAARRAQRAGLPGDAIWDLAMWTFFMGIVGARLFYVVQYHERVFNGRQGFGTIKALFNLPDGGLVLYGGVILAVATFFVFCRRRKLSPLLLADIIIPSFFIGLGFGRIGCFLNGCCYGDVCELPWAVAFPHDSVPFRALVNRGLLSGTAATTMTLHPSQLYSSLNAFVLAALTAAYFRYPHRDGSVLALGWICYPVTRFAIEVLRGDELGQFNSSLTISQCVSIGLFLSGFIYLFWLNRFSGARFTGQPVEGPAASGA